MASDPSRHRSYYAAIALIPISFALFNALFVGRWFSCVAIYKAMKLVSRNPTLIFSSSATYTAIMPNRAFPVQPTANPKKAIECWSCNYGKLPPAAPGSSRH